MRHFTVIKQPFEFKIPLLTRNIRTIIFETETRRRIHGGFGSRNFPRFISGGDPYGCAFIAADLTTVIFSALGIFSIL